jgi:hypothetical protein
MTIWSSSRPQPTRRSGMAELPGAPIGPALSNSPAILKERGTMDHNLSAAMYFYIGGFVWSAYFYYVLCTHEIHLKGCALTGATFIAPVEGLPKSLMYGWKSFLSVSINFLSFKLPETYKLFLGIFQYTYWSNNVVWIIWKVTIDYNVKFNRTGLLFWSIRAWTSMAFQFFSMKRWPNNYNKLVDKFGIWCQISACYEHCLLYEI